MTGYESKRAMARDRMIDDDDTQVYQQAAAFIAAAFIAAEERKVGTRYGYVPKLHPSEYMDEQPAQRPWVGLTDEEAQWLYDNCRTPSNLIDMVEAKLKDKNT
jgi:hypothetical protein